MAHKQELTKTLGKLKEVFLLLDPDSNKLSWQDRDKQKELMENFDFFIHCSRRIADYHHLHHPYAVKTNFSNIVPRFMQLLRETVLTHQWPVALTLVETMTKEMRGTESTIWKVGLACLYQDGKRNLRLVEQFVKQLYILKKLAVVEVMLDYLLFLLTHSDIEGAKHLVQELKLNTLFPSQLTNDKRKLAHTLFFAYQGLTFYAEWKLSIFKADEESEKDFISHMLSQGSSSRAARVLADSAIEYLVSVKEKPGVWDIFITRLVELYLYYGNLEEARSLLQLYRKNSPKNPNAHRYLYELESDNDGDQAIQLECLQDILKLDPCNPLCLKLYNQMEADNPAGAVVLLFDYLDYNHCREDESVWQVMAIKLGQLDDNSELKETVKSCWKIRKDWWPQDIFHDLQNVDYAGKHHGLTRLWTNKEQVYQVLLNLDTGDEIRALVDFDRLCNEDGKRQREMNTPSSETTDKAKKFKKKHENSGS